VRLLVNYRQGAGSGLPDIADKIIGRQIVNQKKQRFMGGWDYVLNVSTPKTKPDVAFLEHVFGVNMANDNSDCVVRTYRNDVPEADVYEDIFTCVDRLRDRNVGTEERPIRINLFRDCVVLTATRIDCAKLNGILQPCFLPDLPQLMMYRENTLMQFNENQQFVYVIGDRVMNIENNYDENMFNGDIGRITRIDGHKKRMGIILDNPNENLEKNAELDAIRPAYALTTHKSQGSEFRAVIIYLGPHHNQSLHIDQWLYTAFTRAKNKVYIFGYAETIKGAIKQEMEYRRTFMKHRMQLRFASRLNDLHKDALQSVPK
jgi:hypothetical protein